MLNTINILSALAISAIFILISYFLGRIFEIIAGRFLRKNIYTGIFWRLFSGAFWLVTLFAVIKTNGATLLLPLLIALPILIGVIGASTSQPSLDSKKLILFSVVCFLVQFAVFWYFIDCADEHTVKFISGDFNIYFRNAEMVSHTHVETNLYKLGAKTLQDISPYHYGDIWFYALINNLVGHNPSLVFLISFSIMAFIFTIGLYQLCYSYFENFLKEKELVLTLLIFSGLYTGFDFFFPNFIIPSAESYVLAVFNWGKVLVLGCSLVGLLLLLKDKRSFALSIMTVVAGLLYLNAIPAIFLSIGLFLLLRVLRKEISFKFFLQSNIIYLFITVAYIILLYKIIPDLVCPTEQAHHESSRTLSLPTAASLKTSVNIFIGGWFQLFTLTPYLILLVVGALLYFTKTNTKISFSLLWKNDLLVYLVMLFAGGLLSWAFLFTLSIDTVQFFHNILAPLYAISISLIAIFILVSVRNRILKLIVPIVLLASIWNTTKEDPFYSRRFNKTDWNIINEKFDNKTYSFINIQSMNNYKQWSSKNTDMYIPLAVFSYKFDDYHNVSVVSPFITVENSGYYDNELKKLVANSLFTQFFNSSASQGISSYESIVNKYIEDKNIDFISVNSDTTLPVFLRERVKDSIVLANSNFTLYRF